MLLTVKLRLVKPLLGETRYNDNIRRFKLTRDKKLDVDPAHWNWAFQQAAESLHFEVDSAALSPELGIKPPRVDLYNRQFMTRKLGKETRGSELHECVKAGTVLTFNLAVLRPNDAKLPTPSLDQIRDMLQFVGAHIGISQWGNKFGYGRFELEELEVK